MFEIRTNSYSISINSLFVTYLHYSNLYSKIKQFVRFLRENNAITRISLLYNCIMRQNTLVYCICNKLRL